MQYTTIPVHREPNDQMDRNIIGPNGEDVSITSQQGRSAQPRLKVLPRPALDDTAPLSASVKLESSEGESPVSGNPLPFVEEEGLAQPEEATIAEGVAQLGLIVPEGLQGCIGALVNGKMRNVPLARVAQTPAASACDTYVASGIFAPGSIKNNKGRRRGNLTSIPSLSFDADLAAFVKTMAEAETLPLAHDLANVVKTEFDRLGLPIHTVVYTGHGVQVFSRIVAEDQTRITDIRDVTKAIVGRVNSHAGRDLLDTKTTDAGTRLVRVPGSLNVKNAMKPKRVHVLERNDALPPVRIGDVMTRLDVKPRSARASIKAPRELALEGEQANEIVSLIAPHYSEGDRHDIALALSGMLAKQGVPFTTAEEIIELLADAKDDEEIDDRLRTVDDTYASYEAGGDIKGYTGLRQYLPEEALGRLSELLAASDASRTEHHAPGAHGRLVIHSMSDIEAEAVDYLWKPWIPRGMITLLAGAPGDGKSTITADIAATLSIGGTWPDGSSAKKGRILFILGEDAAATKHVPLIAACGGDVSSISVVAGVKVEGSEYLRFVNLKDHLADIEEAIVREKYDLVVIDPFSSITFGIDRNDEGKVRDALTPLVKMAERQNVAVICVAHTGKSNGHSRAQHAVLGSTGYVAIARTVLQTHRVAEGLMAIGPSKINHAPKPNALLWRLEDSGDNPDVPKIAWLGDADATIDDLIADTHKNAPRKSPKTNEAVVFLEEYLRENGEVRKDAVVQAGIVAGHSERTLEVAKRQLDVRLHTVGRHGYWSLPPIQLGP